MKVLVFILMHVQSLNDCHRYWLSLGDFAPHDSKEHWSVDSLVLRQMICMVKIDLITMYGRYKYSEMYIW